MRAALFFGATSFFIAIVSSAQPSSAASPTSATECDGALILSTYSNIDQSFYKYDLADRVDQQTYDELKKGTDASAKVFGVSLGASYSDFKNNISQRSSSENVHVSSDIFHNISWTGLDPNGADAYKDCLKTIAVKSGNRIVLLPDKATDKELTFEIDYYGTGTLVPNPLRIKWSGDGADRANLPASVPIGKTIVVVRRSADPAALVLNAGQIGDSDSIILTPFPPHGDCCSAPPLAISCHITAASEHQISPGESVTWACPDKMAAGNYQVSFNVIPGKQYQNPLRVQYHVNLNWGKDLNKGKSISRDSPPSVMDIGVDAGLGNSFHAGGEVVTIEEGPAVFSLRIDYAWDHCCFAPEAPNQVGIITFPSSVSISLDKI